MGSDLQGMIFLQINIFDNDFFLLSYLSQGT